MIMKACCLARPGNSGNRAWCCARGVPQQLLGALSTGGRMTGQVRDRLGRFGIWRGAGQVTAQLATGIENMWRDRAATVAASFTRITARHPGRFLLGVGAGHREATQQYASPLE